MATLATRGGPPPNLPAKVASVPPNQTLYVTNLPSSKIKKDDLRTELYMLFSTYGTVLDVVALKTLKMRGQAHIVFRDIQTATQALRSLNGFEFFGFKMVRDRDRDGDGGQQDKRPLLAARLVYSRPANR